jgi:hypothetical protein
VSIGSKKGLTLELEQVLNRICGMRQHLLRQSRLLVSRVGQQHVKCLFIDFRRRKHRARNNCTPRREFKLLGNVVQTKLQQLVALALELAFPLHLRALIV